MPPIQIVSHSFENILYMIISDTSNVNRFMHITYPNILKWGITALFKGSPFLYFTVLYCATQSLGNFFLHPCLLLNSVHNFYES
jgi:hypothetical protein